MRRRPDLMLILLMLFLIGTFGLNFPIFLSTMSLTAFHAGAGQYGVLSSVMACALAAVMPNYWLFGMMLVVIGIAAQTFITSVYSSVQLSTAPAMRGRVMALLSAISAGGTPLGAPIVGWVADTFGPRWALGIAALSGLAAALVGVRYLVRHHHLRLNLDVRRWRVALSSDQR